MLFTILYYFILFFILLNGVLFLGYYFYQKYSRFITMLQKIPGSKPLPIFGHAIEWIISDVEPFYHLRQNSVIFYPEAAAYAFHVGGGGILDPDDVEKLLSSPKLITKGIFYNMLLPWLQTGLLTSTGEKWFHRRKILTPAFHFSILQNFIAIFNEETNKIVKVLEQHVNDPNVDLLPVVSQFTLSSIAETAMGTKLDEGEHCKQYKSAIHGMGQSIAYRCLRPWLYNNFLYGLTPNGIKDKRRVNFLHEFTTNVIKAREKMFSLKSTGEPKKRLAMLDLLLTAKYQGESIDNLGIREEVDTFMFEGHDTTATAITFMLLVMANYPEIQERCYEEITAILLEPDKDPTYGDLQEMSYIERCIKEVLRLYPSVPHILRTIDEDFTTKLGNVFPKGSNILVAIYDLHRNPEIYPDPEKFDPDRFLPENCKNRHPYAYIPFSAGPRNCIGQRFAMLEMKSILCGVLRKFRLEAVTTREEIAYNLDLILRTKEPVKVKFVPRI